MDKTKIVETLVNQFILKDRRERSRFELTNPKKRGKFIDRLNHDWDSVFDQRKFKKLNNSLINPTDLKSVIQIQFNTNCYIISNNDAVDDKIMTFQKAISKAFGYGLGSALFDFENRHVYIETEQHVGPPERFISIKP